MFFSVEQEDRIQEDLAIIRSGAASNANLCQRKDVSCVRCCLPHIGGDSHMQDSEEKRYTLLRKNGVAYHLKYSDRYLGPGKIAMRFRNYNPLKDPKIEASQYEDSFPDVGKVEMERRFSHRRRLFLKTYDPDQPRKTLPQFIKDAQANERYKFRYHSNSGPVSLFLEGSVPKNCSRQGELPECQLLGFVDEKGRVGCMGHPLAETSGGHDGRDHVGFFHNTGCCSSVGCQASEEFKFLSASAIKVFDKAVRGMSWYEYSRHATSVLVYYLRSFDHIIQILDERSVLDKLTLERLVEFTNALYDKWPMKRPDFDSLYPLTGIRVPEYPIPNTILGASSIDWFTGIETQYEIPDSTRLDTKADCSPKQDRIREIPFKLQSTCKGYKFTMKFPEEQCAIEVFLRNGNKPVLQGSCISDLWRIGAGEGEKRSGTKLSKGKKCLLQRLHCFLVGTPGQMNSLELLSMDIPLSERILYIALDTWFLKNHLATQLRRARIYCENSIARLAGSLDNS
jgi:hypothetical protein